MTKYSRVIAATATVGALAVFATACSNTPTESAQPTKPDSANYIVALAQDFQGVDRASYASEAAKNLGDIQQSRLLELRKDDSAADACLDEAPTEIEESSPLVESWKTTADGLGIEIVLREGVKSAAGNELTAADVEWTIDRIKELDAGARTLWFTVGGFDPENTITVEDDHHFTLNLSEPSSLAPYALAGGSGIIYDSTDARANATGEDPWAVGYLTDHTANFGPWNLSTFSTQQLVFERNENYEGERGNIDTVTVQTVTDASARIQLIQSGQADETNGLDFTQLEQLSNSDGATLTSCDSAARDWLGLNAADPIVGDPNVRQAISLALNRDSIAESVYRGYATAAVSGLAATYGVEAGENYEQNIEKAKSLLADAGHPSGFSMTLSISPAQPGTYSQNLAAIVQQQLGEIGIDVQVKTIPSASDYKSQGLEHSMQAWLMAETPAFANAGYSAWITNGETGLQNYAGGVNPELDEKAGALMDGTGDAVTLSQEVSNLIDEGQPAVYLVDRPTVFVRSSCVDSVPTSTFAFDYSSAVTSCTK